MVATENIRAWRDRATADDIAAGREWYPHARRVSRELADAHGVARDVAAGVIAALSPRVSWALNLQAADDLLRAYAAGDDEPPILPGCYGENIRKAWRIAQHGSGFPVCNARRVGKRGREIQCSGHRHGCAAADYLHGPKVAEFYATIRGKRDGRVMDVWATRAADVHPLDVLTLGPDDPRRDGVPGARTPQLQAAYAQIAAEYGEDPRATQAIVWTRIRRSWLRSDGRRSGIKHDDIPF